jgi:hypothetical protein
MTWYDSDVALVRVLVVLGFLMWLPTDVYLRQAADNLCLQLGLLGLSESICLFHPLWPLACPSVMSSPCGTIEVLYAAVQV